MCLGLDRVSHRLYALPERGEVGGLFAIGPGPEEGVVPGVVRCRREIPGVWLPENGEPGIALGGDDATTLPDGEEVLLLPGGRSIRFSKEDSFRIGDLLDCPLTTATPWTRAEEATGFRLRITNVIVPDLSPPEEMLEEAGKDIGEKSPDDLRTLSDKVAESGVGKAAGAAGAAARAAVFGALKGLGSLLSRGGSEKGDKEGIGSKLAAWANTNLEKLAERQNRALQRLMDMLQDDPEKALRYAIPLGDDNSRGLDGPSDELSSHGTDFSLSGLLGGSGPASPWEIDDRKWMELQRLYREQANRAVRLKNYRRAAYIYAHLLGDIPHAAQVLREGGYAREAALLYLRKVGHKQLAAECFVEAGMIEQAVELYEELEQYMVLADLYRSVGREVDAREAFHKEVTERARRSDHVGASEVLDLHLGCPEEALEMLQQAWPTAGDAQEALLREFELRARERDHLGARKRIEELLPRSPEGGHGVRLAEVFSRAQRSYPDAEVAELLEDGTRVVVSRVLSTTSAPYASITRLMEVLKRVGPEDRFRHRDTVRYLQGCDKPAMPRPVPRDTGSVLIYERAWVESVRPVRLLDRVIAGRGVPGGYLLAGVRKGAPTVVRESWFEEPKSVSWKPEETLEGAGAWISTGTCSDHDYRLHVLLNGKFAPLQQQGTLRGHSGSFTARGPADPSRGVLAACYDENGEEWHLMASGKSLQLSYQSYQAPQTFHLSGLPEWLDARSVLEQKLLPRLWVQRGMAVFTLGSVVGRFRAGEVDFLQLPDPVIELESKPRLARAAVGLRTAKAVWVIWPDGEMKESEVAVKGSVEGLCFTAEGSLVVIKGSSVTAMSASSPAAMERSRRELSLGQLPRGVIRSIFATERRGEFALVIRDKLFLSRLSTRR